MSRSITWRGGVGAWNVAQNWSGFLVPSPADDVSIGAGGAVEIAAGVVAIADMLSLPGGTLRLDAGGALRTTGTIALAGGTLDLAGTLVGGTLAPGGVLTGLGGTLDGTVVQGGFAGLADVTITTATAAANASLPIAATGTLTLAAGRYDGDTFRLDPAAAVNGVVALDAAIGRTVLLGATTSILGGEGAPVAGVTTVLGGGTLANQGTISLVPAAEPETVTVYQPTGKYHSPVATELTWTQRVAPTLDVTAARFTNSGLVAIAGGTLDLFGASVRNTGFIRLDDATTQTPQQVADGSVSVVTTTLPTRVDVAATVIDFSNTGTITADTIRFDGAVSLPRLGALRGALAFAGTLDLGGRTLAATPESPVAISGTVGHGALAAGGGSLVLEGAALRGVTLAGGTAEASGTLHVLGLGGLTLDPGAVLAVGADVGVVLSGVAGPAIVDNGTLAAGVGATVALQAGLAGTGRVELGANAVVTVGNLALFARPTFLFDPGASFLSLPGKGAGVTLADLHAGDVLDFRNVSSIPRTAGAHGAAHEIGDSLRVIGASGQSALVALGTPAHGLGFSVAADGHGGTLAAVI